MFGACKTSHAFSCYPENQIRISSVTIHKQININTHYEYLLIHSILTNFIHIITYI